MVASRNTPSGRLGAVEAPFGITNTTTDGEDMAHQVKMLIGRTLLLAGLVFAVATSQPAPAFADGGCDCAPATDYETGETYTCCWCDNGSGTCNYVCDDPQGSTGQFPC